MPKGTHPNSLKNLDPCRDRKTAQKRGRNGGKKKGENAKIYKSFKECFKDGITDEDRKTMFDVLVKRAKAGNLKAFEILRDTMGEKPTEHVEQTNTDVIIDLNGWDSENEDQS